MSDAWQEAERQEAIRQAASALRFARKNLVLYWVLSIIFMPAAPAYLWGWRSGCLTFLIALLAIGLLDFGGHDRTAMIVALTIGAIGTWVILRARSAIPST